MEKYVCRSQITKITFEGKMFIVHIIVNEVCLHTQSVYTVTQKICTFALELIGMKVVKNYFMYLQEDKRYCG